MQIDDDRGILRPEHLPTFHREPAPERLADLVGWFWIPRWSLPPGVVSRQELLPFPASNLVVEPGGIGLSGPATRIAHRDLTGTGWAVGALLRPAGLAALGIDPAGLRDREVPFEAPDLHAAVRAAMQGDDTGLGRRRAVAAWVSWIEEHLDGPDEAGLLANAVEDLIARDRSIVRVDQVAAHLGLSVRSVQRLARSHVGLPPLAIIRRYRLQEAAVRLRTDPGTTIAQVAADLGYADQAHLSADFRTVLGFTATDYRATTRAPVDDGVPPAAEEP
ncbi:MAG: helix-turn-helix transcriptional regulator [Aeromicrobium sp.]|uniref:helix-turn-helix transcriptional regulator n=1 Tax=Aeromicrobium sp. TaxID=1871063 RepID=UPI0039E6CAC7